LPARPPTEVGAALDAALGPQRLDVVVDNAGIGGWDSLERLDLDLARPPVRRRHADGTEIPG
jgi:hypothetical protein